MDENGKYNLPKLPPETSPPTRNAETFPAGSQKYEESVLAEHKYVLSLCQANADKDQAVADLKL
jgi:hypothetical protein